MIPPYEEPNDPHNTGKHSTPLKKYAYVGGVGFKSSSADPDPESNRYLFCLELDTQYLLDLAKNIKAIGSIVFKAGGTVSGYYAPVEMGIKKGTYSAQAGTGNITASHEIEFHGTNNADVSLKKKKLSTNILSNPDDVDIASEIILASTLKYQKSDWVKITRLSLEEVEEKGIYAEEGLFREYYRVDLNEEYILKRLRKYWYTYLKQIKISDSTEEEQEGVVVKTALTGDMIDSKTKTTFA